MWRRLKYHPFFIRLTNWEYWPMQIANIPVVFFWLLQAIRAGHPMFFTAVNPTIPTGGMFGESKRDILGLIPSRYLPLSVHADPAQMAFDQILDAMDAIGLDFPIIAKPDIGERGFRVARIEDPPGLKHYLEQFNAPVILQEFISYPLELSILCYRMPTNGKGAITSVCRKEFLSVTGDGTSTLSELIGTDPRAILQRDRLSQRMPLEYVPARAELVQLEHIGNHCLGTKFVDANALIDAKLEKTILGILCSMPDTYYGRFDLRARSIEDLREGTNFRILEFNGVASEPAHVYDPEVSFLRAYACIWRHWTIIRRIASQQRRKGVPVMSLCEGIRALREHIAYKRQADLLPGQA